jgi:hypothetical protein
VNQAQQLDQAIADLHQLSPQLAVLVRDCVQIVLPSPPRTTLVVGRRPFPLFYIWKWWGSA